MKNVALCLILILASLPPLAAQLTSPGVILELDIQNVVSYRIDTADVSSLATDLNTTTGVNSRNFSSFVMLGDIVAVNGKPAKGLFLRQGQAVVLRTAPSPGQGIADAMLQNVAQSIFKIMLLDGTSLGSIVTTGLVGGPVPPGVPAAIDGADSTIIGGTGAFLGARGQAGGTIVNPRQASATEDPANRRSHPGAGTAHQVIQIIPTSTPEILVSTGGPAVVHSSDFTLVTAAKPARAGEVLSLLATGLGPTRPALEPGGLFKSSPLSIVNSSVEVVVNGTSAEVLYAGGYPGTTDTFQVNFRLPSAVAPGNAALLISSAWIPSREVRIAVQ